MSNASHATRNREHQQQRQGKVNKVSENEGSHKIRAVEMLGIIGTKNRLFGNRRCAVRSNAMQKGYAVGQVCLSAKEVK
jgi:hypothetical protein